jgi:hypothetical protein
MAKKKSKLKQKPKNKAAKSVKKAKPKKTPKKTPMKMGAKRPKGATKKVIGAARPFPNEAAPTQKGPGYRAAGQSGDVEGLSDDESADSESVAELVEEGQDFEAELVDAVEHAPDPDEGELDAEVPEEDDPDSDVRSFSKRNRL